MHWTARVDMRLPSSLKIVFAIVLVGCSQVVDDTATSEPLRVGLAGEASLIQRVPSVASYEVLFRFEVGYSGTYPKAALVVLNGELYGTTSLGGSCESYNGCGTVYRFDPVSAQQSTIYNFGGCPNDGTEPVAPLLVEGGNLYGTTEGGDVPCNDKYFGGAIFELSPSGQERFVLPSDLPEAGLTAFNKRLYGTLLGAGGASGNCSLDCGGVFAITDSGESKRGYGFRGGKNGASPAAGLVALNGILYGTTVFGGGKGCGGNGCGTVFSLTAKGKERVIYRFNGRDGYAPYAGLVALNGVLYGTTTFGGKTGNGTVFSINILGKGNVLHSFTGGSDGGNPMATLLVVKNQLYGTTAAGGGTGCDRSPAGCGTVFRINTRGHLHTLYRFQGGMDGENPIASLVSFGSGLYGTTEYGGGTSCEFGCGTLFEVTP